MDPASLITEQPDRLQQEIDPLVAVEYPEEYRDTSLSREIQRPAGFRP